MSAWRGGRRRPAALAVALGATLSVALGDTAAARPFGNIGGGAQVQYELASLHDVAHDAMSAPRANDLVLGGFRVHGFAGNARWGYHVGAAMAAGSTLRDGGFAYDVSLFPIGVALRFAETSFVTLGAGIGASGAVGTLDDAVTFPLEARFELGRGLRLLGRARLTFLDGAPSREDGTLTVAAADELEAMLGLRLGRAYDDHGFPTGNGYFIGATVRESLGARFAGVVIGYALDMGTRRVHRRSSCENCD